MRFIESFERNFKLTGNNQDPTIFDYNLLGLHKKRIILCGELILTEYYKNYENGIFSDLVISEKRRYVRNVIGHIISRYQLSTWYFEDSDVKKYDINGGIKGGIPHRFYIGVDVNGPVGENDIYGKFPEHYDVFIGVGDIGITKETYKYYTQLEIRNESVRRRENVVDESTMYVLSQVGLQKGLQIQEQITFEIDSYIKGNYQPLKSAIIAREEFNDYQKGEILRILTLI